MKNIKLLAVPLFVVAVLILFAVSSANGVGPYTQLPTITIPGNLASGFDISWVDPVSGRYYLADRTTGVVDVIDAEKGTYLFSIKGFVGTLPNRNASGPAGVLTLGNELWAGDGNSTVKVADLTAGAAATLTSINTGGKFRADELAYDPLDHVILIANYPQATGGIEQPVWNQHTKRFYIAIPSTTRNPAGEIDELDPTTFLLTKVYPTPCSPAGLALLPGDRLITSCGTVIDSLTGNIRGNIYNPDGTRVSADEIWYNAGDDRVYFGSNFVAVVDASTYRLIDISGTAIFNGLGDARISFAPYQVAAYLFGFPIAPGGPVGGHTVAVDSANNHIFVPSTGVGVKVFAAN